MPQAVDKMILEMIMENKKVLKAMKQVDKNQNKLAKQTEKNNKTLKMGWLKVAGAIASVGLIIKKAFDFSKEFLEYKQGMDALARNTGQNADKIVSKLREVTKGTVANKDIMLAANRLVALNVTKDTDKMAQLFEVARVKAKAMGITTSQAISDISVGIGRASPLILDNLGIITKGWDAEAKSAGKAFDQQFILNKILDQGARELEKTGAKTLTGAERMQKLGVATDNLKIALGRFTSEGLGGAIEKITSFITSLGEMLSAIGKTRQELAISKNNLKEFGVESRKQVDAVRDLARAYEKWSDAQKTIEQFLKTRDALKKQGRDFREEINADTESGRRFRTMWHNANETLKTSGEEMKRYKKILKDTTITTGRQALEIQEKLNKVLKEGADFIPKDIEDDEISPIENKTEKDKATIEDFYSFVEDQRQLDLIKEQEAFEKAKEALDLVIEERKLTEEQGDLLREELFDQHITNMNKITDRRKDKESLTAKDFHKAWQTAIGNTVKDYAGGIADMITTGEAFKKTFTDFIKDMILSVVNLIIKMTIMKGLLTIFGGPLGLLGFAEGTDSAPGGPAIVGERGPELMYVPKKSRIVPNHKINFNNIGSIPGYQEGIGSDTITNDNSKLLNIENLVVETQDAEGLVDQLEELSENVNSPLFRR